MRSNQLLRSLWLGFALAVIGTYAGMAATQVLVPVDTVWKYDDSDADLGSAWKEVGFDDSAWSSGPAGLGFPADESIPFTTVQTVLDRGDAAAVTRTFYFRTHFNYTGDPAGATMTASNIVDDGAVLYLNGVEVGRVSMPEGDINAETLATRQNDIGGTRVDLLTFPPDALVQGDNVLAVEVHQGGATSSDMVFATVLAITPPSTGPVTILTQPTPVEANQGESVTFRVTVDGSPPYVFQWYKDGSPISGATSSSLTIDPVGLGSAGAYFVTIQNQGGQSSVTSDSVRLDVVEGPVTLVTFGSDWSYDDTDTDLGREWREVGFDDSSWASGPSPLGFPIGEALPPYPAGGPALVVETLLLRTVGNFTYYFRTDFQFEGEPLDFELELTTLFDDAGVIYLNGQELTRVGMDEGTVNAGTIAGRSIGNAGLETFTLTSDLLLNGANELAVEMHQVSSGSSDIIMGMRLVAQPLPPTRISITQQPLSVNVEEIKEAVFSVEIVGNTPRYQWFQIQGGTTNLIEGATRPSYSIPNTVLADSGSQFFVVISNVINRVVSDIVDLTVIPDVQAPRLVLADGTVRSTTVIVSFDEIVDEDSATTRGNYEIEDPDSGATLSISRAELVDGTNVVLTTSAREIGKNYILTVNNVEDIVPSPNTIAADSMRPVTSKFVLVRLDAAWDFFDPIHNFNNAEVTGTAWHTDFDYDINDYYDYWLSGNGPLANDTSGQELPVSINTAMSQSLLISSQFRTFSAPFNGSPSGAHILLRHVVDDGAVFYINGPEVLRFNMPEGPIVTNTPAATQIGAARFQTAELPFSALSSGTNLVAAELHQRVGRDTDKVFAMELTAILDSYIVGPVRILSHPEDQTVVEGNPVTFSFVGLAGATFQWRENGVAIPGATDADYTIERVVAANNNKQYSVVVSNSEGSVTSDAGRLTVLADVTPPRVLSAIATGSQVVITFNEFVSAASGNTLANYTLGGSLTGAQILAVNTMEDKVTLTLNAAPAANAEILIRNIADDSAAHNVMPRQVLYRIGIGGVILDWDAVWRYEDSDTDLDNPETGWREFGFSDLTWKSGQGLLGEETASVPEPIRTPIAAPQAGGELSDGPITSYYRTHFNWVGGDGPATLELSHIIDDGAVFYINGEEFYRIRVAAGQVHTDFSSGTVGDAALEGPFALNIPNLRAGDNVLAVEIHQASAGSSDTVMGAQLALPEVPSVEIFVPQIPTLSIEEISPTRVRISWVIIDGEFFLERTLDPINGPWVPFPLSLTAPPATFSDQPKQRTRNFFFRLRENR